MLSFPHRVDMREIGGINKTKNQNQIKVKRGGESRDLFPSRQPPRLPFSLPPQRASRSAAPVLTSSPPIIHVVLSQGRWGTVNIKRNETAYASSLVGINVFESCVLYLSLWWLHQIFSLIWTSNITARGILQVEEKKAKHWFFCLGTQFLDSSRSDRQRHKKEGLRYLGVVSLNFDYFS